MINLGMHFSTYYLQLRTQTFYLHSFVSGWHVLVKSPKSNSIYIFLSVVTVDSTELHIGQL